MPAATPDTIYVRTPRGQSDVGSPGLPLTHAARRLLMLVNGFTPFDHLAGRLATEDVHAARDLLLSFGLIEMARSRAARREAAPAA